MAEDAAGGRVREMPVAKTIRLSLVSAAFDGMGGLWALDVATAVEVFDMYGGTYAVVAAWNGGGVRVINRPHAYSNQ